METSKYKLNFDKNTIDHLGIKLYSSFPPVIVEMISNSYDADAENVLISIDYDKKEVEILDDGIGMSYNEMNENYLVIGRNRRVSDGSDLSPKKRRPVTGKKGLGKLAVFGIAKSIDVISIKGGYKNGFSINYDELKKVSQGEYHPETLFYNQENNYEKGTIILIKQIKQKNIMKIDELAISLSRRFSFFDEDFKVILKNSNNNKQIEIEKALYFDSMDKEFLWKFPEDFIDDMDKTPEFKRLSDQGVTGEVYTKSTPLLKKDSGFLLYVRNKLASENVFFDERANDTFNSYVTGYFNIDFIDDSNKEDFISTARQSILWEVNEEMLQLRSDLNKVVSKISNQWRTKRKQKKEEQLVLDNDFFEGLSASEISSLKKVKDTLLGNSSDVDSIESIKRVLESIKTVFKFESFQSYVINMSDKEITLENMEKIASDWEYIEAKELAKVAVGRIKAIETFEEYIKKNSSETGVIQPFLERFPWLLDPRITMFQRELSFRQILKENFPDNELEEKNRRLDFLCNLVNGELLIIELKRPKIKITMKEIMQAREYERFLLQNHKESIEKGIKTFLISDRYDMDDTARDMYESFEKDGKLYIKSYSDLLNQAKLYNKEFINKYDEIREVNK